ncbi:MAG: hypothetical protein HYV97_11915 [Bdellovibrio sp.]|nr:hypothetical protein [Bdellovibrio sp.]
MIKKNLLLLIVTLCFPLQVFCSQSPKWSLVIYAGTDEEDLSHHSEPLLQTLIDQLVIPEGVELLMEQDSFGLRPVSRIIKKGNAVSVSYIPEADSAAPEVFSSFLDWAKKNKRGTHTLFVIVGHSWGWKGIIQDFSIPGLSDTDTMMPVRIFAKTLQDSALFPDVALFDSCITGNAEFIDEFRSRVPYLVASQRETPYGGMPFRPLLELLSSRPSPRVLAKALPKMYVRAYAREGEMSPEEGEYDVVTTVSIDMGKWEYFVTAFKDLVTNLQSDNFRERLRTNPTEFSAFTDMDSNIDLIEFLKRISAKTLLKKLTYDHIERPDDIVTFSKGIFHLLIQSDEILAQDTDDEKLLEHSKTRFLEINKDFLSSPDDLVFKLVSRHDRPFIQVTGTATRTVHLRPWLPGSREIVVIQKGKEHSLKRSHDYISTTDFPKTSFILATATTQGAPFVHGIGLNLNPLMDEEEERGEDPLTGLRGPYNYATTSWNKRVGWGDLIHLHR